MKIKHLIEQTDCSRLTSVMKTVQQLENLDCSYGADISVLILRNYTLESLSPFLKFHLYGLEMNPVIQFGNFSTMRQDVDAMHELKGKNTDLIVLSLMLEEFDIQYQSADWDYQSTWNELEDLFLYISSRTTAPILVNTFLLPDSSSTDYSLSSANLSIRVNCLNDKIRNFVVDHPSRFYLSVWDTLVRRLGSEKALDKRHWYLSRAPFKSAFLNLYATDIANITKGITGKVPKCIVVDCDNTLWGGVIGEVGLDGISLHPNRYPGNIFYQFQSSLIALYERGFLLTLCSKNNAADVFEVLDKHPHCLLGREHLAAYRINWSDKSTSIQTLAAELNLGLDSFVFIDDSAFECQLVSSMLPQVQVLQVPEKLYLHPETLDSSNLFVTLSISDEDSRRTALYQQESLRKKSLRVSRSLEEYLQSLSIKANIQIIKEFQIPRVAQLTQRTNQFNLSTIRYSEADITGLAGNPQYAIYTLSVSDKFGDLGLVGVMIIKNGEESAEIDSLLMSCRALGRGLEYSFSYYCLHELELLWGVRKWKAEYRPTAKNAPVKPFLEELGFDANKKSVSPVQFTSRSPVRQSKNLSYIALVENDHEQ